MGRSLGTRSERLLVGHVKKLGRVSFLFASIAFVASSSCAGSVSSANPSTGRWLFSGLVLERADDNRGPIACFGGVAASDPPSACGGWPIRGWDWATAPQARNQANVRTSSAVLTGHVEGDQFVLDEAPAERPATDNATFACSLIGNTDEPAIDQATVNARFDTPAARAAGLYPTTPHSFRVSFAGDPAVSGWLGLTVLADTPEVRSFLLKDLQDLRTQICSVLRRSPAASSR